VLPCSGIALVSDGTCYVLSSINRASGALLTALIKYDSAGNVLWTHNVEQWAFSSVRGHHLLPISDGLIVAAARLQRVSSSGSILWENAAYSGYQDSFSSIEGTDDFIVYKAALSGQQRRIERWTPEPVCVWSMPEGVVWSGEGAVSARPDGSGNVLLNQSSRQPFIQPFSSNGLLGNTNSLGGSENCEHWWDIDTFPSEDAFLISGFLGGSGTFGAGQPNETTLTGPALFLAKYRAETLYYLDADVIGYGNVEIRPSVVPRQSYSADTPVTLRAVPNWPNHDRFVEWQGDFTGTNDEITINLTGDSHVTAIFEEIPGAPPLPAISTGVLATLAAVLAGIGLVRRK
jgi:hypothetical protein